MCEQCGCSDANTEQTIEEKVKAAMAQIKPMSPAELPDIPPGMYG